jgi:hypothetical protein
MPILNGLEATRQIRHLEVTKLVKTDRLAHLLRGRIPIFAESASLVERQCEELEQIGIDKRIFNQPIDFERLYTILRGVTDPVQCKCNEYRVGGSWEIGRWLQRPIASI